LQSNDEDALPGQTWIPASAGMTVFSAAPV
jgi:hypothetical protein